MKTAFVIQIIQLGQYRLFSRIGVPESLDFTYVSLSSDETKWKGSKTK